MSDTKQPKTETVSKDAAKPAPAAPAPAIEGALDEAALAQVSGGAQEDYVPAVQANAMGDGSVKPGVKISTPPIGLLRPGN
jgi:hypothetical protein